jgi:hypothetical protein
MTTNGQTPSSGAPIASKTGGDVLDADDGPQQGRLAAAARAEQTDDLTARNGHRQVRQDGAAPGDDPREHLAGEELAQHPRPGLARRRRAHQGDDALPPLVRVPDSGEEAHQTAPDAVRARGEHAFEQLLGPGRELEGGDEQRVLAVEVVVHEPRVDAGRPGDPPDRRGVEAAGAELVAGRGQDVASPVLPRRTPPPSPDAVRRLVRRSG